MATIGERIHWKATKETLGPNRAFLAIFQSCEPYSDDPIGLGPTLYDAIVDLLMQVEPTAVRP